METKPIRVLYVNELESDADLINSYLAKFESAQFEVVWQQSGEKALEYLAQQPLVDVNCYGRYSAGNEQYRIHTQIEGIEV